MRVWGREDRERARKREAITHVPSTLTSTSFRESQSLVPRSLAGKSISSWFHQHYKQCPKGATDCVFLLFSLFLSIPASFPFFLPFFSHWLCLVPRDSVAGETRPPTGPLRQKTPKYSTAQLNSGKLLWIQNGTNHNSETFSHNVCSNLTVGNAALNLYTLMEGPGSS